KVLMRVDFNVPLDSNCTVTDSTRIKASLPSIRYVLDRGGALILMSHLGRPLGRKQAEFSLAPIAKVLSTYLDKTVEMAPDCIGECVKEKVDALKPGNVLLLENLRFHRAEEHPEEDPAFAKELASFGDFYVNDAFGTAHRKHSSTYTIAHYFPGKAAAGYLLAKEIYFLSNALTNPERPFYAILGGAKISTKIGVVKSLLKKVDRLLIGGGMAYTFLKSKNIEIGDSLIEEECVPMAAEILKEYGEKIVLPIDTLAATERKDNASAQLFKIDAGIPKGYQGLDIGPHTVQLFNHMLKDGKTILWNGPLGVYEIERFAQGTIAVAQCIAHLDAVTIVGGGDLVAAIAQAGGSDKITHISTGGGATLEFIELGTLPGIEALSPSSTPYSRLNSK
ncbi:MAG TPA: phosphoglycerate kinase, partial [Waddliaceae bacterium]